MGQCSPTTRVIRSWGHVGVTADIARPPRLLSTIVSEQQLTLRESRHLSAEEIRGSRLEASLRSCALPETLVTWADHRPRTGLADWDYHRGRSTLPPGLTLVSGQVGPHGPDGIFNSSGT